MKLSRRGILKLGLAGALLSSAVVALFDDMWCRGCERAIRAPHVYSDRFGAGLYCPGCGRNMRTGRFDFVPAAAFAAWDATTATHQMWNCAQVLCADQDSVSGASSRASRLAGMRF